MVNLAAARAKIAGVGRGGYEKRRIAITALSVLLLNTVIAAVWYWPLLSEADTHIPRDYEARATVPLFDLYTLEWVAISLGRGWSGIWSAPFFFPHDHAFALSETQIPTGIVYTLFRAAGLHPVIGYNLTQLFILIGNGCGAYFLARVGGCTRVVAALMGIAGISLPFVWHEIGVMPTTVLFPSLAALGFLYRFYEAGRFVDAIGLGVSLALTVLFTGYYGLFLSVFVLPAPLLLFSARLLTGRTAGYLAAGALLGALMLAPVLPTQLRAVHDFEREPDALERSSAKPIAYFQGYSTDPRQRIGRWFGLRGGASRHLYPGTGLVLLAALVVVTPKAYRKPRWRLYFGTCLAGAFILSLGGNVTFGETSPVEWLHAWYPGFAQVRSYFRFAAFVQIFLLALAAPAALWLWRADRWKGKFVLGVLLAAQFYETHPRDVASVEVPAEAFGAPWLKVANALPEGPGIALPFVEGRAALRYEDTVVAMLQALRHGKPIVNGYSSFWPATHEEFRQELQDFPDTQAVQVLRERGIAYGFLRRDEYSVDEVEQLEARGGAQQLYADEEIIIVRFAH